MPWGITLLAALSVLLLFKVGDKLLKRLGISLMMAQILIFMLVAGSILPNITLGKAVVFNVGGFVVPLFIGIVILTKGNKKEVTRGFIGMLCVAAALLGASYFIAPVPQGFIFEPMILYGIIAAVVAFLVGYNLVSAVAAAFLGVVLWDIAQGIIIKYIYNIGAPIELGLYNILNTTIPAVIISGVVSYLFVERKAVREESKEEPKYRRLGLLRKNELFEISDEIRPKKDDKESKGNDGK